ncbi:GlcG/HbpS family heme-binding protein [Sphingopyxis sp.]|uniref:GlcG/HbpS family heme-binding protein n=1 Tax=Sphingopyxis sp. TaxID=1908224 RepID=UPI003D0F785C
MMKTLWSRTSAAALVAILAASPVCAETSPAPMLTLAEAKSVAARAERAAAEKKVDVAIVIVNREGRVILSERMDGVSFVNLALAEKKAVTTAATGVPTSILEKATDGGKPSFLSVPEISVIGGAVPLLRGERVIGGIGISGGTTEDDEKIATAGAGS